MSTLLFLATVAVIGLFATFYPALQLHAVTNRRRRSAGRPTAGGRNVQVECRPDRAPGTPAPLRADLLRDAPLAAATWLAFIAVDFKLAIEQPIEAGLLVGMAAVLRRYSRKRLAREMSQRPSATAAAK